MAKTQKFSITGMSCAACQARIENAVSKMDGVSSCAVSLLTNSMTVESDIESEKIIKCVEKTGYGAKLAGNENGGTNSVGHDTNTEAAKMLDNTDIPLLKKRLISSVIFLVILMYFSMAHMMFNAPLPSFLAQNHVAMGLVQMILATIILFINRKFFISGTKALIHLAPNMDTLVALGSGISFLYSTVVLFEMTDAVLKQDTARVMQCMDNFYFEGAAMIVTLITVGKLLEAISKGKTTNELKSLLNLAAKTATLLKDGKEITVDVSQVQVGDIFIVRGGQSIPTDGIIIEGNSAVDESSLTGESVPVDKNQNDEVTGGTIVLNGFLKCRATRIGKDTTLSKIIQLVSDAASTKAPIAKIADKVSLVFVPAVMAISLITFVLWMIFGKDLSFALARAISVLVVSCPCALGLATPVAIMVANGVGAKNGILFKTSASLEETGKMQIVALDKTGTITKGQNEVVRIVSLMADDEGAVGAGAANAVVGSSAVLEGAVGADLMSQAEKVALQFALNLEEKSSHPLAKAIVKKATECGLKAQKVSDFTAVGGRGVKAKLGDTIIFGGNLEFALENLASSRDTAQNEGPRDLASGELARDLAQNEGPQDSALCESPHQPALSENLEKAKRIAHEISMQGQTPLIFGTNEKIVAIIAVCDVLKSESPQAIQQLQNMGIQVVMLTGDNQLTAEKIAQKAGVNKVIAGILPDGKDQVIQDLRKKGKVAMVGDGINDSPALKRADIGIAIGNGSDIAIEAADIVLVKSRLDDVCSAIRLSRRTLVNIKENLFWAFFYNIVLIPIAAGVYYPAFKILINPMLCALAMSLSSFCVVTNALRLNLYNIKNAKHDRKIKFKEKSMEKTLKVEGMMCAHCEAHVKEALEKIKGVECATADHTKNRVVVTLSKDVSEKDFEKAVKNAGYNYLGLEG